MVYAQTRYTIKYSYAGFYQYADFHFDKNNVLISNRFSPSYAKLDQIPKINKTDTIKTILRKIKKFSFNNNAEIFLINGNLVKYHKNEILKTKVDKYSRALENTIDSICKEFFIDVLVPFLKSKRYKLSYSGFHYIIPIKKNKEHEWDNIKNKNDEDLIEFICKRFIEEIWEDKELNLKGEQGTRIFGYMNEVCKRVEDIEKHKIFINL